MTQHARHRPLAALALAALALAALIIVGCSNAPSETGTASSSAGAGSAGTTSTAREKGVKFSRCMRDNGVSAFPDPDASGELTIDAIANGSSLDTSSAAFEQAISACKDLQPAGFTGHKRSAQQQGYALKFAQCIRDNGVEDFPDPTPDAPLVDTTRIPSTERSGGMSILNAAMQKCGAAFSDKLGVKRP
jgi:hypothetical protein